MNLKISDHKSRTFFTLSMIAASTMVSGITSTNAYAGNENVHSSIKLYFSGIPVGKMKSAISVNENSYSISSSAKSTGIAKVVAKTVASFSSSGTFTGTSINPKNQSASYSSGKKSRAIALTFENGDVVDMKVKPKFKYKPGSVEVTPNDFRNVIDPVSTLIVPVSATQIGNGPAICNRTLSIFTGISRLDLKMSYKSQASRKTKGFKGKVFTCRIKYQPVAGHRPSSKNTAFMMKNNGIEVSLARVGNSRTYALYGFTVPVRRGTVTGEAAKFKMQ